VTADELLFGELLPASVAALVLILGWQPWRRTDPPRTTWSDAAAFGCAYGAAHVSLLGRPMFPPAQPVCLLAWLVVVTMVVGGLQGHLVVPSVLRFLGRFALGVLMLVAMLQPLAGRWPTARLTGWLVGLMLLAPLLWTALARLAQRSPDASLPLSLAVTAAASSAALRLSGDSPLWLASGALAAGLIAWSGVAFVHGRMSLARGALPVVFVLGVGAPLLGRLYASLPAPALVLLTGALVAPAVAELPWLRGRPTWERAFVRVAAAAIPALAAVVTAAQSPMQTL
jgi:hypothetical protein